jgi:hypothetical protein
MRDEDGPVVRGRHDHRRRHPVRARPCGENAEGERRTDRELGDVHSCRGLRVRSGETMYMRQRQFKGVNVSKVGKQYLV